MGRTWMRITVALAGAVVLVSGLAAPASAGDVAGTSMTRAQARAAYLNAACPLNASLIALDAAEKKGEWPAMSAALRVAATNQLRAARLLDHPARPWPSDIRQYVRQVRDMDTFEAGISMTLSLAGSMAAYEHMVTRLAAASLPGQEIDQAGRRAVALLRPRIGLPEVGGCPAR